MYQRWVGPLMVFLILGGVALVLVLNLNLSGTQPRPAAVVDPRQNDNAAPPQPASAPGAQRPAGFREYPIGEEVERHEMLIAAVWLPPVLMDGMAGPSPSDMIHIEADVKAAEANRNGCKMGEFIPYLTVRYAIVPEGKSTSDGDVIRGDLKPMVARDGWHYGASISMPKAGRYKLTYALEPPSAGRHSDPATGVEPWWKPFEVSFDWDYPGPSGDAGLVRQ